MAIPEKVISMTMQEGSLTTPGMAITTFDRGALINWLNSSVQPNVALYFESEGSPGQEEYRMVMAPATSSGDISPTNHMQSAPLPCPPYCKPRNA